MCSKVPSTPFLIETSLTCSAALTTSVVTCGENMSISPFFRAWTCAIGSSFQRTVTVSKVPLWSPLYFGFFARVRYWFSLKSFRV